MRLAGALGLLLLCMACNPASEAYHEGRKAVALIETIYRSNATGRVVEL